MTKPFILITNDDGIYAAGIKHLWHALRDFADLVIVAPNSERSGSSAAITFSVPLHLRSFDWEDGTPAWSANGTPADCVKMALNVLLEKKPDLVVSGVNAGSNAGRTIFYSGTVGAVIEATIKNVPGIAFSFCDFESPPLGSMDAPISAIVRHFLRHPLPHLSFLNVTFPSRCEEGAKGIRMARQGEGYWTENFDKRIHPEGVPYYWLGGRWDSRQEHPESDIALAEQGYIAIAPIRIADLTDQQLVQQHRDSVENIYSNNFRASAWADASSSPPPGSS